MVTGLKRVIAVSTAVLMGVTSCLTGVDTVQAKGADFNTDILEVKSVIEQETGENSKGTLPIEYNSNVEIKKQIPQEVTEFELASVGEKKSFKISDLDQKVDKENTIPLETGEAGKARSTVTELHASQEGYLSETDAGKLYYLEGVNPGILIQARLKQPNRADLDYDLYILNSEGTILAGSENYTYINNGETCPESVSIINTENEAQDYYFYVHSSAGGSTTEAYTIEYAISYPYDDYEPDDNILNAKGIEMKTGGIMTSSCSISNPVDTDWYVITIPETKTYSKLKFSIDTNSENICNLEVYDDINGYNQMRRKLSGNGEITIQPGKYYVRISYGKSDLNTFNSDQVENYTLTVKPVLAPDKIEIKEYYSNNTNAGYVSYPQGHYYRAVGSVEIRGYVVATDPETGTKYGIEDINVTGELYNVAYDPEEKPQFYYRTNETNTDDTGYFKISMSFAPCTESFTFNASRTIHYYDMILAKVYVTNNSSINKTDYLYQLGRTAPY